MPQARKADHLVLRISSECAASYGAVQASSSAQRLMRPCTSGCGAERQGGQWPDTRHRQQPPAGRLDTDLVEHALGEPLDLLDDALETDSSDPATLANAGSSAASSRARAGKSLRLGAPDSLRARLTERISAAGEGAAQAASHALEASEVVAAAAAEMAASMRNIRSHERCDEPDANGCGCHAQRRRGSEHGARHRWRHDGDAGGVPDPAGNARPSCASTLRLKRWSGTASGDFQHRPGPAIQQLGRGVTPAKLRPPCTTSPHLHSVHIERQGSHLSEPTHRSKSPAGHLWKLRWSLGQMSPPRGAS